MRTVIGFVIAIAIAGCGGGDGGGADGSAGDMATVAGCPDTINEGDSCPTHGCNIAGYPCHCGADNRWTCPHVDMTMPHD